jgi:hypothetical protein
MLRSFSAVVVTGGSSGLGKSFIEHIAKVNPGIPFCNLSRHEPVIILPQLNLRHFACDLEKSSAIEATAREILEHLSVVAPTGRVLLINNSGFGSYGHFSASPLPQQLGIVDVNIRAPVHLTGRLLPMLLQRGGAILNVASTAAFQPTSFMATYGASKAFLLHWSLALNEELRGSGVNALAVCPGPTATGFSQRAGLDFGGVPTTWCGRPCGRWRPAARKRSPAGSIARWCFSAR